MGDEVKVCQTCNGSCCRDDLNYKVGHLAAETCAHWCDDCDNGTPRKSEDSWTDYFAQVAWERGKMIKQLRKAIKEWPVVPCEEECVIVGDCVREHGCPADARMVARRLVGLEVEP